MVSGILWHIQASISFSFGVDGAMACRVQVQQIGIWRSMARDPFVDDAGPALASLWGAGVHTRYAA